LERTFVNETARDAYQQWETADAAARASELEVAEAWQRSSSGEEPDGGLVAEALRLRARANNKLTFALFVMGAADKSPSTKDFGRAADSD
jgi:hypothetical protein